MGRTEPDSGSRGSSFGIETLMGFYERSIAPHLVTMACSMKAIERQRERVVPLAKGRVLEVGVGAGLNFPYYRSHQIEHLYALEPSDQMRRKASKRLSTADFPVEWLSLPGEEIPLDNASVDDVLVTYTLCTIPDVARALSGIAKVLKPGGRLIFCEHGKAPDPSVAKFQSRLNPIWRPLAGGCNLNRDVPALLVDAGFELTELSQQYLPKTPRCLGFNTWGIGRTN